MINFRIIIKLFSSLKVEKSLRHYFQSHYISELPEIVKVTIIQNRFNKKLMTNLLFLILRRVPEEVGVFADKGFYFGGVQGGY